MAQTVEQFIAQLSQQLAPRYTDKQTQHQVAWWLLEAITQQKKVTLLTQKEFTLTAAQQQQLDDWLTKLIQKHEPLQYLIGWVPFCDLKILVQPPTLIPRPETEEWCAQLIKQLAPLADQKLTILDLCTGSGCIAVALAKALPQTTIYATDIAEHALELAARNVTALGCTNVHVIKSDLFEHLPSDLRFDLIVANPPYVTAQEWETLDTSVTQWEDKTALVANKHGLSIVEKIIAHAPQWLKPNDALRAANIANLLMEIGHAQGPAVKQLLEQHGYTNVIIAQDMAGKDRVAHAHAPLN